MGQTRTSPDRPDRLSLLIARFLDPQPELLFVPKDEVLETATATGAIPYDTPGVELGHAGELCAVLTPRSNLAW